MRRPVLAVLALAALAAPAWGEDGPPARGAETVSLRFGWTVPARARVSYRRTRVHTGRPRGTFVARYETVVERDPADGALRVGSRATTWRGDVPYSAALAKEALRASEQVVQRVGADGKFERLEGLDALRRVISRVLEDANVPPEQAERALSLSLAATRSDAEELWNMAVGFWTGADLRLGEKYAMQTEADLPLVPGVRVAQAVEFSVRRRVPCAAAETEPRCVEAVLRSVPDRGAVERAAPTLLERLLDGAEPPEGAVAELSTESELVLVTDPATLLPHRLVWTEAVRLGAGDGPPRAEQLERSEYDWRWIPERRAREVPGG